MDKNNYNNSMRLESYDLEKFSAELYELNGEKINNSLPDSYYLNAKRVIATGCGDSFCAALAATRAFKELAKIPMYGLPAIEVSRNFDSRDMDDTLLFGISSRGKTSRVIEAAMRVNKLGKNSNTVAIVNFKVQDSKLENECNNVIRVQMPVFECGEFTEHAPCQRSYFSTMFTLMLIAIKMGESRGNYTEQKAQEYRQGMITYAKKFDKKLVDDNDDRMWELSKKWQHFREYEVIGSTNEAANVWFGAAKVVEAFGDIATYENSENWMCINLFAKNPQSIGTVVIVDKDDEAKDVTLEAINLMAETLRPVIVLTDIVEDIFPTGVEVFRLPTTEYRWAKPLMQYSPLGNLLGYIAKLRGASFYRYGGENNFYIKELTDRVGDTISGQPLVLIK